MDEIFEYKPSFEKYHFQGNLLNILTYPAAALTKVSDIVTEFNQELKNTCLDMLFTMYKSPGIGLAAPQVGINKRFFVADLNYEREEVLRPDGSEDYNYVNFCPLILINPEVKLIDGEVLYEEGCLSVPGVYEKVKRVENIEVKYQNLQGEWQLLKANGLFSVCLQHEIDHLNGIVFIDKLSFIKKDLIKKRLLKEKKRKNL